MPSKTAQPTAPLALLGIPLQTLVELWGELVEAYCGQHGFGGHTAQVYAYRFVPYTPVVHSNLLADSAFEREQAQALQRQAAAALLALCQWFSAVYPVTLTIDDLSPSTWYAATHGAFTHRVHVKVVRTPAPGL